MGDLTSRQQGKKQENVLFWPLHACACVHIPHTHVHAPQIYKEKKSVFYKSSAQESPNLLVKSLGSE